MNRSFITFEFPLNERFRTFLRVEHLFKQIDSQLCSDSIWDSKSCINSLMNIVSIIKQHDLKKDIINQLENHIKNLNRLAKTPSVNRSALQNVLEEISINQNTIQALPDNYLQPHREIDFLARVNQRYLIPGGILACDLPEFHLWLNLPFNDRQKIFKSWLKPLIPLKQGLGLIMHLTRESNLPSKETAFAGVFQKNLPIQNICYLIKIELYNDLDIYPEFSGNQHKINLRFFQEDFNSLKSKNISQDIYFELTCCS